MKNSLLFVAGILLSLSACKNKSGKKSIIGKWKFVVVNVADATEEENQEVVDNVLIEFKNDSQFVSFKGKRDSLPGKYAYNQKDSTLTILAADTEVGIQHFKVIWSADTLIIKNEMEEMKLLRK